jgi:shikimate dehydrogenase
VIDLDAEIVKEIGMSIKEYFNLYGEEGFRRKETEITKKVMNETGVIIATGGGIVTRKENMIALHQNGFVIWIKRSLNELETSDSRPLSSQKEQLVSLYEKRKALYEHYCDAFVLNDCSIDETILDVMKCWKEGIEL